MPCLKFSLNNAYRHFKGGKTTPTVYFLGYISNLRDLASQFRIDPREQPTLLATAFKHYGSKLAHQLKGDYQLIFINEPTQSLHVIQSAFTSHTFYYQQTKEVFYFSNCIKQLKILLTSTPSINASRTAHLLALNTSQIHQTFYTHIAKLPGGHYLSYQNNQLKTKRFWFAENFSSKQVIMSKDEITENFKTLFLTVIEEKIAKHNTIASEMSGGLDSASVSACAASLLKPRNQKLYSFGAVPAQRNSLKFPKRNNWNLSDHELMAAIAQHAGNIELTLIDEPKHLLTLDKLGQFCFDHADSPIRNPMNMAWLTGLYQQANALGVDLMLNGNTGNATISWSGYPKNISRTAKRHLRLLHSKAAYHLKHKQHWWQPYSLIEPNNIKSYAIKDPFPPEHWTHTKLLNRYTYNQSDAQGYYQALQNYFNFTMFDPSADQRIIEFCLSVPNSIYHQNNLSRCLIREAMQGLLPNSVRLNTTRGEQHSGWFFQLKALVPHYQRKLATFQRNPLIAELINLKQMEDLLKELSYCNPMQHSAHQLTQKFRLKLARGLHIADWLSLHE